MKSTALFLPMIPLLASVAFADTCTPGSTGCITINLDENGDESILYVPLPEHR
jgi:hypothetical protein